MGTEFKTNLASLRKITSSDFSAIACIDPITRQIRWQYVSGNKNERYKKMITKPGVGISGKVIRFGKAIIIDENVLDLLQQRLDSPIMLSEDLQSVVAVPVIVDESICAVLLVGSRFVRCYSDSEINSVIETAQKIAILLKQNINTIANE